MDASWMEPKPKARQAIESWTLATDDMRPVLVLGATAGSVKNCMAKAMKVRRGTGQHTYSQS